MKVQEPEIEYPSKKQRRSSSNNILVKDKQSARTKTSSNFKQNPAPAPVVEEQEASKLEKKLKKEQREQDEIEKKLK